MAKSKAANGRVLPKKRNPLLVAASTPEYSELVSKRRLGRTNLHVKDTQVGTTNATKPENLGTIEYAYLGAPLPAELKGSEIFAPTSKNPPPEEYFMMRRSKDGFVSATGMFKVAFPWAKFEEERSEREYLQTLEITSADEQAGNIWIREEAALELADEYGIRPWLEALLDPALPPTEPHKQTAEAISPPPKFEFTAGGTNGHISASPSLGPPASPAARSKKSKKADSPTKSAKSSASPRKRLTKAEKEARANAAKAASESLQSALDTAASVADSESVAGTEIEGPKINGNSPASPKPRKRASKKKDAATAAAAAAKDTTPASPSVASPAPADDDKVTVQVESTVETQGDIERTHTNVRVLMPADSPELPLPESTEDMIAEAKKMVEEARRLEGDNATASSKKSKRKADEIEAEDDELAVEAAEAKADGRELQPAKKVRLMEQQVRTQKVRSRALMGLAATLTIGAIAPYFLG